MNAKTLFSFTRVKLLIGASVLALGMNPLVYEAESAPAEVKLD